MIREALKPNVPLSTANRALWDVVRNTWFHCVTDVRKGEAPVILLTEEEQSFSGLKKFLD